MRILLISEFFPTGKDLKFSGGVEARTFFLAKFLAKKHKITVLCSRQQGSKRVEKMYGFTVYREGPAIPYNSGAPSVFDLPRWLGFVFNAIKKGSQFDVNIVDGGNFTAHFIAKEIGRVKKIPVVFWYPDVFLGKWIFTSGLFGGFGGWLVEKFNLLRSANFFISISKKTEKRLKKEGVPQDKITKIPCGIDPEEFRGRIPKNSSKTIVIVSRLVKYKNVDKVIFAFAYLLTKISPKIAKKFTLKIIGSGPEKSKLVNLAKHLKILNNCLLLENLPRAELIKELKSSHVFSLPSLVEGFGIVTIEAAAAGLPYVVSDIPTHKEVTRNGQGGFLVNPNSPIDFSNRFFQLLTDKKLYLRKSKDAKNLAKNYNWQDIAKTTEKVYQRLIHD